MSYGKLLVTVGSCIAIAAAIAAAQAETPAVKSATAEPVPLWAFPGPMTRSVPGSKAAFSDSQLFDRVTAVDWFPDSHPTMPASVKGGSAPLYACGFCHLPQGAGRPENAALAGMPYEYLKQQIDDMQSGARTNVDPHFFPGNNMITTIRHKDLTKDAAYEAAKYYSTLKYTSHTKIVESNDIPHVTANSFIYVFDKSAAHEALGERIVEGPDDFERFEMRDPNGTFTAYVPPGSIARGAALAKGEGGAKIACETCHGPGLKGSAVGPPIAGRPLTPIFRQLYAIKIGTRNGPGAAVMKPIVAGLSQKDMIDLAAYVGSLEP